MFIVSSSAGRFVPRYQQEKARARLLHEGEPAIAEGECSAGRDTALPNKDTVPPHPSRASHCRAPPKQSDSSGPLFFQGQEEKEAQPKMKKEKEAGLKTC